MKHQRIMVAAVLMCFVSLPASAINFMVVDIGTLGGSATDGKTINATGMVTGVSINANDRGHAFLWDGSSMVDLGTLGGDGSYGTAINDNGWVTGTSYDASGDPRAFLWDGAGLQDISLGGTQSFGEDINNNGWVVGTSYTFGNNSLHPFLWNGNTLQDLGSLGGHGYGREINNNGMITGSSQNLYNRYHPFLWNSGSLQDLMPSGTQSLLQGNGLAINANGWITGGAIIDSSSNYQAYLWNGNSIQTLGTIGAAYPYSTGEDINVNGWVTGYCYASGGTPSRAFIWKGTTMDDLGTLGGSSSRGTAINDNGWVVGSASNATNSPRAVLWDGNGIIDLNSFMPVGSPYLLFAAYDINNAGQIVAQGVESTTYSNHTFVLTPVPEYSVSTGTDVPIDMTATLPDGSSAPVTMSFDNVTSGGQTSVTTSTQGPPPPTGFKLGSPPVYYDITTTATFTGNIELCLTWTEGQFNNEQAIDLWHNENGVWVKITTSLDTTANQVCGSSASLSPFAIMETSYQFNGFFPPVDNPPVLNRLKAGQAVPVKFSLGGDYGLDIFIAGSPASQSMSCSDAGSVDTVTETVTTGSSSLEYDSSKDQYTYVWKTQNNWANSCRTLILKLKDGGQYSANFQLKK